MATSSQNKPATSMADLMANYKKPMSSLSKGDIVEGVITKLTPQEVLVDINAKTDAVVMEKEKPLLRTMLATLKVGDKVKVSILNPESDEGHPVVSLRRFMGDASWKSLESMQKEQTPLTVTITDVTRGGYLVATDAGVAGFLPNSHISFKADSETSMVGKKVQVYVLELSRNTNKIIFSQKETLKDEDFTKAIALLKKGETVSVVVTNITSFGVFAAVPAGDKKLDGLIHISEVAWEKTTDLAALFEVGQTLQAQVIGFDKEGKRVDLSIKRLTADPFEKIAETYPVDTQVQGTVVALEATGVVVELADGTAGFIRKEKIPPTVTYKQGDSVKATVAKVDKRKQRIDLVPVLVVKPLTYR